METLLDRPYACPTCARVIAGSSAPDRGMTAPVRSTLAASKRMCPDLLNNVDLRQCLVRVDPGAYE